MVTDTTEKGLEALITNSLTSNGWLAGNPQDYLPTHCVDLSHISAFLHATQPETAAGLALDVDSTTRKRFLDRLKTGDCQPRHHPCTPEWDPARDPTR